MQTMGWACLIPFSQIVCYSKQHTSYFFPGGMHMAAYGPQWTCTIQTGIPSLCISAHCEGKIREFIRAEEKLYVDDNHLD